MPMWANGKVVQFKPESSAGSTPAIGTKIRRFTAHHGPANVTRGMQDPPSETSYAPVAQMEEAIVLDTGYVFWYTLGYEEKV